MQWGGFRLIGDPQKQTSTAIFLFQIGRRVFVSLSDFQTGNRGKSRAIGKGNKHFGQRPLLYNNMKPRTANRGISDV